MTGGDPGEAAADLLTLPDLLVPQVDQSDRQVSGEPGWLGAGSVDWPPRPDTLSVSDRAIAGRK